MPVYHRDLIWPDHKVPYVQESVKTEVLREAITKFNAMIGHDILAPRTDETIYAEFEQGAFGCSSIGCQRTAGIAQKISVTAHPFEIIHEICHCLGFEHEQFHPKYLWDDSDFRTLRQSPTKKDQNVNVFNVGDLAKKGSDLTKFLYSSLADQHKKGASNVKAMEVMQGRATIDGTFAVNQFAAARVRVLNDNVAFTDTCDYNSIMMYPEWRKAAKDAKQSGKAGNRKLLQTDVVLQLRTEGEAASGMSLLDVQTIKELYPAHK